jgi:glycerophosphoryl diester phosphodiesterase
MRRSSGRRSATSSRATTRTAPCPPPRSWPTPTAAGLQVVPYTFRDENRFLPAELRRGADPNAPGDAAAEYRQFYALGVDGVFSDHPDTAVAARDGR